MSGVTEHSGDTPTVGIVVLTWENYGETSDCLDSLESISYPNYRVVVVDNGSEDGSLERLRREYEWCEFVANDENLGFARGNNAGIRHALDAGVDYVLLLNDDTIVTEDFLEPLVETAERYERVAAVGGVIHHAETGEIHNAGYRFYPWAGGKARLIREPPRDEPYPVDYVQTCLVLLDPDFLTEISLLNDAYFLGMEDVDLAWKARARGWKVLTTPDSKIYHRIGLTGGTSPFMTYHSTRNKLQFAAENFSLTERTMFYPSFAAVLLLAFVKWAVTGQTAAIRTVLIGLRDYAADAPFRPYSELAG
ncbi:glycosyltransferase family 2 protein [Halobellus rarus]|uniref:Glycosyltransferase family 2 protein n=1 Tax=Halobellus rarus TaxID=1126237 RepID=A0ABD6CIG5_9EURY|nr:glycosyltransferase family 2 protein [Halobellus rarus]